MLENRTTDEMIQIARAGGGFELDAAVRTTDELVQIARAASGKGANVTFTGLATRTTDELIQIARAGKGCVIFE